MGLVAMQLENRYGVTVEFSDPEIATLRVSGTFPPEESLNNVLRMLGFVNSFKYTTADGKQYILSRNLK
jgi:ferric-dicitrate binding protein FerR (iron transport regulator)